MMQLLPDMMMTTVSWKILWKDEYDETMDVVMMMPRLEAWVAVMMMKDTKHHQHHFDYDLP